MSFCSVGRAPTPARADASRSMRIAQCCAAQRGLDLRQTPWPGADATGGDANVAHGAVRWSPTRPRRIPGRIRSSPGRAPSGNANCGPPACRATMTAVDHFAGREHRFDIRRVARQAIKFGDRHLPLAHHWRRAVRSVASSAISATAQIGGMRGDAMVAAAEDRQHPALALDRRTTGPGSRLLQAKPVSRK